MLLVSPAISSAQDTAAGSYRKLETKYIFGFTEGSDIGSDGERAIEIAPKVTLGGELEFYHASDSFWLANFAGHAIYAGPTLFVRMTSKILLAAAFSTQIAGHAAGNRNPLDLTNFSRNNAR